MSAPNTDFITASEYLQIERKAEIKSEYIAGRMYAMSGASRRHNLITANTVSAIHPQLRGKDCRVYVSDMRVKVRRTGAWPKFHIDAAYDTSAHYKVGSLSVVFRR
jgi:Uma2 family endonuclease